MKESDLATNDGIEKAVETITGFLRSKISEHQKHGVCLGLSGGVDSAVVATLAVRATEDAKKVSALHLPDRDSGARCTDRARRIASFLGVDFDVRDISELVAPGGGCSPVVRLLRISPWFSGVLERMMRPIKTPLRTVNVGGPVFRGFNIRHRVRRKVVEKYELPEPSVPTPTEGSKW